MLFGGDGMLLEQCRQQPVGVQIVGRPEHGATMVVDGFSAVDDVVEGVPDRNQVVDGEGVSALDEHSLHDLQRGALALHDRRQVTQRGDQHRGERVGQPELSFGGSAVLLIGVEAVAQHIPHLGVAGEVGEGLVEHRPGGVVLGLEQPGVGNFGQVIIAQFDLPEAALLVLKRPVEGLLLGPGCPGVGEPLPKIHLP